MSNIDDIFKKGLDGKGMEYSDASWAAMEGMLGGKKVGFIDRYKLLLGLVSVLLISSVGLWYFINQNKANTVNTPSVVDYNEDNTAINKTPGYMDTAESTDYESSKVLATEESGTPLVNKELTKAAAQTNIPRIGKTVDIEESGRIDYSKGMISDNPTAGVTTLDPTDNGFRNYEPLTVSAAGSTRTTSIDVTSSKEAETLVKPNFQDVILTNVIGMNEFGYEVSANGASELDFLKKYNKEKVFILWESVRWICKLY